MKRKTRNEKRRKHDARRTRIAKNVAGSRRPRLTIYRSSNHIYAQLLDAETGATITTVSTRSKDIAAGLASTGNIEAAKKVGAAVAAAAREKQIEQVVFNRNGFLYHGRVKALADAAREAGLQF